jgi:hypothetical protein
MKTIKYSADEWDSIWHRLAKDHTALTMGKSLGFTLRKKTEVVSCDDAPAGYDRITAVYLDFERDEDYTLFLLKYQ